VRTIVAYPEIAEPPRALAGTAARAVVLDTELKTRSSRERMNEFIRKENVKVVYLTDRPLWSFWYPFLRKAGVRSIVVHDHTSGVRSVPTGLRRAAKRLLVNVPGLAADVIVGVSDFVVERDKAATLIDAGKFRRVWNGVDPVEQGAGAKGSDVRTLLGLSADTPLIGCACRATKEKGVDVLFSAFDRVCRASSTKPVLAFIGNGPQYAELMALRSTLSCADRIHMLGYLPQPADLLRSATVCAVPSVWQEAFALSVLEMMARGCAVVATRAGGIPEVIEDSVSGLLVPPNDVNALADALTRVLASPALQRDLGRAARLRASQLFTAERQVAEMLDTFQDVFSGEPVPR
jgi:glycosyltransferase involved in cell wall biosynthesis